MSEDDWAVKRPQGEDCGYPVLCEDHVGHSTHHDVRKRVDALAFRLLDRAALSMGSSDGHHDPVAARLYSLSLSIAAGTSQIQKNIVGERILGLPKER